MNIYNSTGVPTLTQSSIHDNTYEFSGSLNITGLGSALVKQGIMIENAPFAQDVPITITDNEITNAFTAIGFSNVGDRIGSLAEISNNFIYPEQSSSNAYYGIRLQSSNKIIAGQNFIQKAGTVPTSEWPYGVSIETSGDINVIENALYKLGSGIRVFNSYAQQVFQCNEISNYYRGVLLEDSWVGDQGNDNIPQDNKWLSPVSNSYDAYGSGSYLRSAWYTRVNSPNSTYFANNQFPAGPTSTPLEMKLALTPQSSYSCNIPCPGGNCRIAYLVDIALRQNAFISLSEQALRFADYNAFLILQADTSLMYQSLSSDSILQLFYTQAIQGNIGKFEQVKQYLNDNQIDDAKTLNQSIIPDNQYEEMCQIVNDIYIQSWADEVYELTQTNINELEDIAYLNPIVGGPCVYSARTMLGLNLDDNLEGGLRATVHQFDEKIEKKVDNISVYPNPSTGEFVFETTNGGILEILNVVGKSILVLPLIDTIHKVDLSSCSNGVYFYNLLTNSGERKTGKLTLLK